MKNERDFYYFLTIIQNPLYSHLAANRHGSIVAPDIRVWGLSMNYV